MPLRENKIAAGALGVAVAACAVAALVMTPGEPSQMAGIADEAPVRLPVDDAEIAVCMPADSVTAPAVQPGDAAAERVRIPMKRRRALVPLDDRTSVVMETEEGAYEVSFKRVRSRRPRRGGKRYEHRLQTGEAVELPTEAGPWFVIEPSR